MASAESVEISEIAQIALASARAADREVWRGLFALDARLGRIVAQAREPLLAQMRLAWWRDELAKPAEMRVTGDPTLAEASRYWSGAEAALIELVDGWEGMLGEKPLGNEALCTFARGRGAACAAVARLIGCEDGAESAGRAGEIWALAELAAHARDKGEREIALSLAHALPRPAAMPRGLRPLTIIDGLSRRAVARGGAPLFGDRWSPLVAFRLGILGR